MSMDKVVNLLVTVTLFEMMTAIGLGVTIKEVTDVARNLRLVSLAVLANYVIVPAIAVTLLSLFHANPMAAAGILIAAACPGAPYGPPFTAIAKGNVVLSIGLMVILAASSAILAPVLLSSLLPVVSGSAGLTINTMKIVSTLLISQIIPLSVGLTVRNRNPDLAAKLQKPANRLSALLNLMTIGLILSVQFHTLTAIHLRGFLGMLLLVVAALSTGWLLGGPGGDTRRALGFTTGIRNVAVGLVIATSSFPGTAAVTSSLAYAIFQTVLLALIATLWGRLTPPLTNAAKAVA